MCLSTLQLARLKRVVYGAPDFRLGAVESFVKLLETPHPFHPNMEVKGGVLAEESAALLRSFFRKRRTEPRYGRNRGDGSCKSHDCSSDSGGGGSGGSDKNSSVDFASTFDEAKDKLLADSTLMVNGSGKDEDVSCRSNRIVIDELKFVPGIGRRMAPLPPTLPPPPDTPFTTSLGSYELEKPFSVLNEGLEIDAVIQKRQRLTLEQDNLETTDCTSTPSCLTLTPESSTNKRQKRKKAPNKRSCIYPATAASLISQTSKPAQGNVNASARAGLMQRSWRGLFTAFVLRLASALRHQNVIAHGWQKQARMLRASETEGSKSSSRLHVFTNIDELKSQPASLRSMLARRGGIRQNSRIRHFFLRRKSTWIHRGSMDRSLQTKALLFYNGIVVSSCKRKESTASPLSQIKPGV